MSCTFHLWPDLCSVPATSTVSTASKEVTMITSTHNLPLSSLRWKVIYWARSIQPKFQEISVQKKKKLVHLFLRWTTFPGPTGRKFWLNGSRPLFKWHCHIIVINYGCWVYYEIRVVWDCAWKGIFTHFSTATSKWPRKETGNLTVQLDTNVSEPRSISKTD